MDADNIGHHHLPPLGAELRRRVRVRVGARVPLFGAHRCARGRQHILPAAPLAE